MTRPAQDPTSWAKRPLCRHYVLGIFDSATLRLRDADQVGRRSVHWAFGCLLDGACESLGVWFAPSGEADCGVSIVADLQRRGVERIWHVTGDDVVPVLQRVTESFAGTSVFSCGERSRAASPVVARPQLRSPVELMAERARNDLIRALRRHGGFENEGTALDFISGALQRTERRLDRESAIAKGRPRQRSGAQTVPPGL